jgi:hypothetical protein
VGGMDPVLAAPETSRRPMARPVVSLTGLPRAEIGNGSTRTSIARPFNPIRLYPAQKTI